MELNLQQTVNRMKDLNDDIERLAAKEDLSPEQDAQLAEDHAEFDALENHRLGLIREERLAEVRNVMDKIPGNIHKGDGFDSDPIGEPGSAFADPNNDPWNIEDMRARSLNPVMFTDEIRARALSAVELMPGSTPERRETSAKLVESHQSIARYALATSSPAYQRAFTKYLKHGDQAAAFFTDDEQQAVIRAMSLTDAEGGFLVPFQLDPSVIITSDGSLNEIRQIARVVQATGDVWNGVSAGATAWSWDAEAAEVSDDASTFAQPAVTIHKAQGFIPISIEALADEANVSQEIGRLLAFGKDELEGIAFATGSGTGEPFGIVTAVTAEATASATTDVYAVEDLYAIYSALPARYRANGSFLANNGIYNLTRQFDTGGGADLWTQLAFDRPANLLGKPAYEAEAMDGTVTALATNLILLFGDFSHYVIADRVGMNVELIPHLFSTTSNLPSGQRGIFAYYRVGADSVNDSAFELLDVT
jgi:HK97 family phage major capsid protein